MVESSGLLPIALGIGLAVISGSTVAGSRSRGGESRWHDPLFVFAALLIGVSLLGAALYLLGWSVEKGHKLPRAEARAENWWILTLALLVVALAARSAWLGFFYSEDALPWEPGRREHHKRLWGFSLAALCVLSVGLGMDVVIFLIAKLKPGPSILLVAATVAVGLASAYGILRALSGGDPSPRAIAMSRRTQRKLLSELEGAAGRWQAIEVSTVGQLDRPLALKATVWITSRGMYWRLNDVFALLRYHDWAANHLLAPTKAVHTQRLMFATPTKRQDKHLVVKPWPGGRSGWRDELTSFRVHPTASLHRPSAPPVSCTCRTSA
jgi:MFS family permease